MGYAVCVVVVSATFTVARIRRLKTCDYILHGFTLHVSRKIKSPLPLFKKEGF